MINCVTNSLSTEFHITGDQQKNIVIAMCGHHAIYYCLEEGIILQ